MLSKVRDSVVQPFYAKMFFIIFMFLNDTIAIAQVNRFLKIGLALSAVILIFDFVTKRQLYKARYGFFLLLFCVATAVSVLVNRQSGFKANIIELFYLITYCFALYPCRADDSKAKCQKELAVINSVIISASVIASLLSVVMFLNLQNGQVQFGGLQYQYGMYDNRLSGVYLNPNRPNHIIGIFAAAMQAIIIHKSAIKKLWIKIALYTVLSLTAAVNFFHFSLAQSRTSLVGLLVAAALLCGFLAYKKLSAIGKHVALRLACGALAAGAAIFVITFACDGALLAGDKMLEIHGGTAELPSNPVVNVAMSAQPALTPVHGPAAAAISRPNNSDAVGLLTGRQHIWKIGLERFKQKPVFGYGPHTLGGEIRIEQFSTIFSDFHNVYINTLVATGLAGALPVTAFLICLALYCVKYFAGRKQGDYFHVSAVLFAFVIFMLTISLTETTFIFALVYMAPVFWIYAGYLIKLADSGQPFAADKPMRLLDRLPRFSKDEASCR